MNLENFISIHPVKRDGKETQSNKNLKLFKPPWEPLSIMETQVA